MLWPARSVTVPDGLVLPEDLRQVARASRTLGSVRPDGPGVDGHEHHRYDRLRRSPANQRHGAYVSLLADEPGRPLCRLHGFRETAPMSVKMARALLLATTGAHEWTGTQDHWLGGTATMCSSPER